MSGYRRLAYVALNATDPQRTEQFYRDEVGLAAAGRGGDGAIRLRAGEGAFSVVLYRADLAGLKRIAFEMEDAAALDALTARLAEHDIEVQAVPAVECADLGILRAVRIAEPGSGAVLEFHEAAGGHEERPFEPTLAQIQRLGHVVIKSPRWQKTIDFFRDALGFSVSDIVDGNACFMRCTPNPYHHSLAVGAGQAGLHHVNFMVTEIDDIGRALHRFKRDGIDVVAGPGRHPTSGSVFLYFLDPDGLTVEYSFGMEQFPAENPRAHRVLPATPESLDTWASPRDPRHGASGAIEPLGRP